jgi:hypothetical protein
MEKMHIILLYLLCVLFILLLTNNTVEEGIRSKKTSKTNKSAPYSGKIIAGIRKIPFYNSLPRGLRGGMEKFISFIIFI